MGTIFLDVIAFPIMVYSNPQNVSMAEIYGVVKGELNSLYPLGFKIACFC